MFHLCLAWVEHLARFVRQGTLCCGQTARTWYYTYISYRKAARPLKTAFAILKRDLLALVKNPIALLVVGALLILPGLYAWYCILANWDPYSNTASMPIAIVNEDKGANNSLTGEVNVGDTLIEKLHDNDSLDWQFYDDLDEALEQTRIGAVYATILLPEDLSENLIGIVTGSDKPPTLYYYPNEKFNAVATKVTDSAAQTLIRQVNGQFTSKVNEAILKKAQSVSDSVEQRADATHQSALAEIRGVRDDLAKVVASLDDALSSIAAWKEAVGGAQSALSATAGQLSSIRTSLENGSAQIDDLRAKTNTLAATISAALLDTTASLANISGRASSSMGQAAANLKDVQTQADAAKKALEGATDLAHVEAVVSLLDTVNGIVSGAVDAVNESVAEVNSKVQQSTGNIANATNRISNEVMPMLSNGAYQLAVSLAGLGGAIGQFEPHIGELQSVLAQTDGALTNATGAVTNAKALLGSISTNLDATITDMGALSKALEIDRITQLLNLDPDNVGQFISQPVQMVTEKIYPVSNYGTAVAPFYTNLALWVGCFILISLMKIEIDRTGFEHASSRERYFGRWLLFIVLSLLQSQVICGVDILLGIDCTHPALFMLAGAVCSFAYMNLIYALVSTFRNIGKTLCIFLLIMQVPGSSGMYPIEMMPGFFQAIHSALPFTYGIDAMREALSGLYGSGYVVDLLVLTTIVPVSLLLGVVIRPNLTALTSMFDDELGKAGFFAGEHHVHEAEHERLRNAMRLLRRDDAYRDDFEKRAWRFNRHYPRLRRAGEIALFAIPFALLVLMLPFNLALGAHMTTDMKLTALIIMLVVLFIVQMAMIMLEYVNRTIAEETKLLGEELMNEFDLSELMGDVKANAGAGEGAGAHAGEGEGAATGEDAHAATAIQPATPMVPATVTAGGAHAKRGFGPARDIFHTDMRLGFRSVIGAVVIVLLVVTPSMYAWFNIASSWDPYSSTGNLKVAVANEDEGYKGDLLPVTVNVGDTIVSQLRGNTSFSWEFVDGERAVEGVRSAEYYAAIVVPTDFSRNLMTYLLDDTAYPDVLYYTNEKENPIAPIITQKGASAIQENIRQSFTESIDTVVLGLASELLAFATTPEMSDAVQKMSGHLDDATRDMRSGTTELRTLSDLAGTIGSIVDTLGSVLNGVQASADAAKVSVSAARAGAAESMAALDQAKAVVDQMLDGQTIDIDGIKAVIDAALGVLEAGADTVPGLMGDAVALMDDAIAEAKEKAATAEQIALLESLRDSLVTARDHSQGASGEIEASRVELDALVDEAHATVQNTRSYVNSDVAPVIESLRASLSSAADSTGEVVAGLEDALSGVAGSTTGLSGQMGSLSSGLTKAGDKLETAAKGIDDTKARLHEALTSCNVKQMEEILLGADTEAMAASLAAPIQLERQPVYSVSNYGSAMAPFYTVLSLWVGALVMISTMRVHVVEERLEELRRRYGRVATRHQFLGRYLTFGFIGLLQSALVLLGDLCLLHIQCVNPVLFFLFGLFIGQAFCLVVYTITELFGDVGKALCVILLIMQVAASGGTFPAQMLHTLLFNIVPFLPFYHAMSLLQECVAGIYWMGALVDIAALLVMVAGILIIALPLRRPFRKLNDFLEAQLEKTGYM